MQAIDILRSQLEANYMLANKNLDGISHAESLVFPDDASNPTNWILGHLIFSRNLLLEILGGEPIWKNFTVYDRGYNAKDTKEDFRDFEDLRTLFVESQKRLIPLLDRFEGLSADAQKDVTLITLHEIYHCGQIGYMRRLLGKEGVIK